MTEAVGPVEPRSSKVAFASALVFVLVVAFAAAFYYLDGMVVVTGLLDEYFAAAPAGRLAPKPALPAAATVTPDPTSGLKLPSGVDEAFAKRMYVEQLESQANIGKLVAGKVKSFAFGKVALAADRATVAMSVTFTDGTTGPGVMTFAKKGGKWYLESVTGDRSVKTGGEADTVSRGVDEDDPAHVREAEKTKVDTAVLNTLLEQHGAHQELIASIIDGRLGGLTIESVDSGAGTATLRVALQDSGPAQGRVLCISKDIDGIKTWFIASFEEV